MQAQAGVRFRFRAAPRRRKSCFPRFLLRKKIRRRGICFCTGCIILCRRMPPLDQRFGPWTGIVSIGEIAPQLFELHAATAKVVKAGNHYALHVRAIHPASSAPVQGVAVQASLDIDEDKPILTSKAVTDSRGYATLEFSLPGNLDRQRRHRCNDHRFA